MSGKRAPGRAAARAARTLPVRDFERLQQAILALHSHRDILSFRAAVPRIFMQLIPATRFSLVDLRVDLQRSTIRVLDLWEWPVSLVGEKLVALEKDLFDHPFAIYAREKGFDDTLRRHALRLSDFVTLKELRKTRLYREALKPTNRGRLLSIGAMGGPGLSTLSLSRPESAPDFSERDRQMLETMRPHFDLARLNIESEQMIRANGSRSLRAHGLTPREIEVALWLAQGKSNHEIAALLLAPVRTIEKHLERILRKMGVENRVSAAVTISEILSA